MTAARTARSAWLQPALFWVFWMVAGYVGGIFYFLPMAGVHLLMGLDKLAGPDIPRRESPDAAIATNPPSSTPQAPAAPIRSNPRQLRHVTAAGSRDQFQSARSASLRHAGSPVA